MAHELKAALADYFSVRLKWSAFAIRFRVELDELLNKWSEAEEPIAVVDEMELPDE